MYGNFGPYFVHRDNSVPNRYGASSPYAASITSIDTCSADYNEGSYPVNDETHHVPTNGFDSCFLYPQ